MKILLVDDDIVVAERLAAALAKHHYAIDTAASGRDGWALMMACSYALILLDIVLPDRDGIGICRELRSQGDTTPVLLLTARDDHGSVIAGLDAGADDYVTKPFDLEELLARMRALLRREPASALPVLGWGALQLDPNTQEVTYQGEPIRLRPKEYELLELFLRNPQRAFSRSAILDRLWSLEEFPSEETVTAHIKGLRRHLKAAGVAADPIETIYGIGYRLRDEPPAPLPAAVPDPILPAEVEQKAVTAAIEIWERAKTELACRLEAIERFETVLRAGGSNESLRQAAEGAAHKLVGSLGTFNFARGSELARSLEERLQQPLARDAAALEQIVALVDALRQEVRQAIAGQAPSLFATTPETQRDRPLLLVASPDVALAAALAEAAGPWGFATRQAHTPQAARQLAMQEPPHAILLDVAEFDRNSNGDGAIAALQTLLAELNARTPPVLTLILAEGQSTRDRARCVQWGGRGFLPRAATPTQVMEAVVQLLQQERSTATRILAVDDDRTILAALRQLLLPWGMELFALDDPRQFWETLETVAPELLILDVAMPHINGIELCQIVRNDLRWGGLPILFLTARADAETMQAVFAAGADDYLCKPIVGPEVIARISNRLERSRLLRNWRSADPLTGLTNRQQATGELEQLLQAAEREARPLCLAVLAVDGLCDINRQMGHAVGDRILAHLGALLRQAFPGDVAARWGGAEFVVGTYGMATAEGVQRLAATLSELRKAVFSDTAGAPIRASFSAGVAVFPKDGDRWPDLWRAATDALQRAQATGGDRIACTHAPEEDIPWNA